MYSEKVMDHFQNPRNVGEMEDASGVGTVGNAKCGDIMRIYLDIDENQTEETREDKDGNEISYQPPRYFYSYDFMSDSTCIHNIYLKIEKRIN